MTLQQKLELLRELVHDPEVRPFIEGKVEEFGSGPRLLFEPAGSGKSLHCLQWAAADPERVVLAPTYPRSARLWDLALDHGINLAPRQVMAMTEIQGDMGRIEGPVAIDDVMDVLMIAIGPRIEILTHRTTPSLRRGGG